MAKTRDVLGPVSWIGQRVARNDGFEKVTGRTKYTDDFTPSGCLHGATVRSPKPHVKVRGVDARAALAMKGVHCVLTARDVPGTNRMPLVINDYPFLADGVARFVGEAVALVVADSPERAREAAHLVTVDYEEMAAVFDAHEAMKPDAPRVYGSDNIFRSYIIRKGDTTRGFGESDIIVEGEFETGYQAQAYIETQGMIAEPQSDGTMLVAGSLQCPFYVHDAVVAVLGTAHNRVRIVQRPTGGGFGGKEDVPSIVAAHAALAAHATGRPVKFIYTREEDFLAMSKRHPGTIHVRYGAKRDGTLVACDVTYVLDGGAYATLSPVVLFRGAVHAAGPYRIPHVSIDAFAVATNKVPAGAFRGFGQPQVCFAQESLIDELARQLAIDPFDLRMKNMLRIGDTTATGHEITESCGLTEAFEVARRESKWDKRKKEFEHERHRGQVKKRGIGVSANYYGVGLGAMGKYIDRAGAQLQVQKDGSVLLAIGNTEIGQGARTSLCQIAAEALGAPFAAVHILDVDTTRVPDSGPTVASRTTVMSGNAILDAARSLRAALTQAAAKLLGVAPAAVTVDARGYATAGGEPLSFARVAAAAYAERLPMSAQGWTVAGPSSFDENGQGAAYVVYAYSVNVAEVEVDLETAETRTLHVTSVHDIGRVVNPMDAEGQVEGGIVQGMGYVLFEEVVMDGPWMKNGNLTGYILPTAADSPTMRVVLLEHPFSGGPYGAKGLAETPIVGSGAAITSAIAHATGCMPRQIPVTPERLHSLLATLHRDDATADPEGTRWESPTSPAR